ncbi:energy transducer TonB [Solidesulfovibrio sp. C21]|uniref:energy transducer TonB n=1 Tax=Solidesulfovibrio sp. C21 TaxID=3398613 RepID=UPI0039FC6A86
MEHSTGHILHDMEQDAAFLDAGPVICEQCSLEELEIIRCTLFDAATDKPRRNEAPWIWLTLSLGLHAVLLVSLAAAGVFTLTHEDRPLETVVELNLGGLAGPGGSGGNGQLPGGGDGRPAGGTATQPAAPEPPAMAPPEEPSPPPEPAAPPQQAAPVPSLKKAPTPPTPQPAPAVAPKAKPEPTPKARPETKPAARRPPRPSARQVRPEPTPAAAPVVAATGGQGQGAGLGSGEGAPGIGGQEGGKGPGHGPGTGGSGGAGPGGGGGGEYVGAFGTGDGPIFRHRTLPRYPGNARIDGEEGSVVLRLFINAAGELQNAEVVRQTSLDFARSALVAVRASTFFPAKRDGHPVPCRALLTIRFKLD